MIHKYRRQEVFSKAQPIADQSNQKIACLHQGTLARATFPNSGSSQRSPLLLRPGGPLNSLSIKHCPFDLNRVIKDCLKIRRHVQFQVTFNLT